MSVDIVGLGNPVMDLVINVPFMPPKDGAVGANEIFYQGGGKVSTAMAACARLGVPAGILAKLGGDFTGDFVIRDFEYNGVDTSRILRDKEGTTGSFVISLSEVETGTRIFIGRKRTAAAMTVSELDYDYIAAAKYLLLENGEDYSVEAAKFAKKSGVTVALDGDSYTESMEKLLPFVDVFIGSEFYHEKRFGSLSIEESCREIMRAGPGTAWFTLGARGCAGVADGEFRELPCFEVAVRDTTGAGDVFHGAYLAALSRGHSNAECARYASAASAIKCTFVGGRTGIPNRAVLEGFLRDGVIDTGELEERLRHYRAIEN